MHARTATGGGFHQLADELEGCFATWGRERWTDSEFGRLALRVFRHQYVANAPYRLFCEGRGASPDGVERWEEVPAVPATAFKHLDLFSAPGEPEVTFLTSGTTAGAERRGRHHVARLSLYRSALLGPFRRHLLGDGPPRRFVSLIPSREGAPTSSLSHMVAAAGEELATGVDWVVDTAGTLDLKRLRDVCERAHARGEPYLLLGTALSFLHLSEALAGSALATAAEGSRVMETGGFKGAGRSVARDELYERITASTGVPAEGIVSEYGMTELLSQLYEPVLHEGLGARGTHQPAPWLRVRALDPVTLEELPEGEEGILAFFDLANVGSISHVLTEDVGSVTTGRVRLRGRRLGAEPRGCSRAMDELMASARGVP